MRSTRRFATAGTVLLVAALAGLVLAGVAPAGSAACKHPHRQGCTPASSTTTKAAKAPKASAPAAPTGGTVVLTDKSFVCNTPVHLASVTVTIRNVSKDAVLLRSGCTGSIGKLTVVTYRGDGIKVGNAHDLSIGSGSIRCYGHDVGKHQDGVQALGGQNVTFSNMDVGCYSANNSQVWINDGAGGKNTPTNVVFHGGKFDGKGSGAYGVAIVGSIRSGVTGATICPNAHPVRALYVGSSAQSPVMSGNSVVSHC